MISEDAWKIDGGALASGLGDIVPKLNPQP